MKRSTFLVLLGLVLIAVVVRLSHWPALQEVRDGDELGYTWGSLQLLEGNLPAIHYAPAGPQTWFGWACAGVVVVKHLILPDQHVAELPRQLRPFLAVDRTLFDAYRDIGWLRQVWILTSFAFAIGAIVAFFRLGLVKAGVPGALFASGTAALLPLFVDFSVQARPYMVAWSCGIIALYYAVGSPRTNARVLSAVFMGLAIGSRVDMAILLPVIWSAVWQNEPEETRFRKLIEYHLMVGLAFITVAPWYLMTLLACIRAISTIRGFTTGLVVTDPLTMFRQAVWEQGMLLHVPLFLLGIGVFLLSRPRRWILAVYLMLVGFTMFKGAAFGFRYQGAPIILVTMTGLYALAFLRNHVRTLALGLSIAALMLPLLQTLRLVTNSRREYVHDDATRWIEQHVPAGTIVYVRPWITNLLPTLEAADAGWTEVAATTAHERKFQSGLQRFDLVTNKIPRAGSEVNLALERGNRRFLFILGGHQWLGEPRFDTRIFQSGPVFGVRDLPTAFKQTGGVVIIRGPSEDPLVSALGSETTIAWLNRSGDGTRVYCSQYVISRLK